jgi:hypothetical protein
MRPRWSAADTNSARSVLEAATTPPHSTCAPIVSAFEPVPYFTGIIRCSYGLPGHIT